MLSIETMEVTSKSMPVPFVQDLAKEALTLVPERYVRPHHERPILSTTTPLPEIPVIDLSKLLTQDHKGSELEKLHYACKEWGFFQVYFPSTFPHLHLIPLCSFYFHSIFICLQVMHIETGKCYTD